MKKIFFTIIGVIFLLTLTNAQPEFSYPVEVLEKVSMDGFNGGSRKKFDPGAKLVFVSLAQEEFATYNALYLFEQGTSAYALKAKDIDKISFSDPTDVFSAWQIFSIQSGLYEHLITKGMEYELRGELNDYSADFIRTLNENNMIFEDDYLTDYVQSLLYRVHPGPLEDQRPGTLNVLILKSNTPNAFSLPNGTVVVTTGMLSLITSEDELLGVLAHEAAHFVLDHHVVNISTRIEEEEKRQRRAQFWAGFATVVAAASEAYLAIEHDVYLGGSLTYTTAILSNAIANEIVNSVGINYNHEQELEADQAAYSILEFIGANPIAYAVVLKKLKSYNIKTGNTGGNLASYSHPNINSRVQYVNAKEEDYYDADYQIKMSFVNTYNAKFEFYEQHYSECEILVDKNINAGIATESDYLLKAMITRIQHDTPEKNREALGYIEAAKSLNITPKIDIPKQEGITYLRLGDTESARNAFLEYEEQLFDNLKTIEEGYVGNYRGSYYNQTRNEIEWVKKMLYKVDKM